MLYRNMNKVYIDEDWVVQQYLKIEKEKSWDALDDRQDLLVLNLEEEIFAESQGAAAPEDVL